MAGKTKEDLEKEMNEQFRKLESIVEKSISNKVRLALFQERPDLNKRMDKNITKITSIVGWIALVVLTAFILVYPIKWAAGVDRDIRNLKSGMNYEIGRLRYYADSAVREAMDDAARIIRNHETAHHSVDIDDSHDGQRDGD